MICLVAPELGNGPLNAIIEVDPPLPRVGQRVAFGRSGSRQTCPVGDVATCVVAAGGCFVWTPTAPAFEAAPASQRKAIEVLSALAAAQAPEDGLARLALGQAFADTALARVAGPRLERVRGWLAGFEFEPPTDLIGLGPGLTPSGDDLMCGVMLALHAGRQAKALADLSFAVGLVAPRLTAPLSCAFLEAAAQGEGAEALHAAINALIEGRWDEIVPLALAAGRIGHTSGWDALSGVALVLSARPTRE